MGSRGDAVIADERATALFAEAHLFDDPAIEHLANKGLLRRARKLLDEEPLFETTEEALHVVATNWRVIMVWATPVSKANCPCATSGVCQHVVAAILALRNSSMRNSSMRDSSTSESLPAEPTAADSGALEDPASIREQLLGLTDDELGSWSKAAELRWALQRLASIDPGQTVITEEGSLNVEPPAPYATVRFMGASLDSAIVKPTTQHDRRAVVLALLALWSSHDRHVRQDNTSKPHRAVLPRERSLVLRRAEQLCRSFIAIGLLHLGETEREKLDSLAASARGVKLYRLALLAERSADQVDALMTLSTEADTSRLLDQLAEMSVVAGAIEAHIASGRPVPEGLCGTARASYEPMGQLRLLGVGHYDWGDQRFAGTTGIFISETRQGFTVAHPHIVNGRHLPNSLGWSGVTSLSALTGRQVALSGAKGSDQHRLSGSQSTSASILGTISENDLAALVWNGEAPANPSRLLGRSSPNWVVLAVEGQTSPPAFDPITQQLRWGLTAAGKSITATVAYSEASAQMVLNLERLATRGAPDFLVGRLRSASGTFTIWPISLMIDGTLHNLATASAPAGDAATDVGPLGTSTIAQAALESVTQQAQLTRVDNLDQLRARLARVADSGNRPDMGTDLAAIGTKAQDWGYDVLFKTISGADDATQSVLRAAWTVQLLRDVNSDSSGPTG